MNHSERKRVELDVKLASIDQELSLWLDDTEKGRALRKHRSQIGRVVETLRGMLDGVITQLHTTTGDASQANYETQENLLEVYRVWEFFRSKFALRYQQGYRQPLAVADEYAWACYEPALRAADPNLTGTPGKEPPLVHLSGAFSPYTHPRSTQFTVEEPPGAINSTVFLHVVLSLPVPVIGMPWHQIGHLPDFPLLAHEVGHCVDQDFGLRDEVEDHIELAVSDLPAERRAAWHRWGVEAFADSFATLAAGPAYVSALADFLMSVPTAPGDTLLRHPPAAVRLALTTAVLDITGFVSEAQALRRDGSTSEHFAQHEQDAWIIATALITEPHAQFCGRALKDITNFSAQHQTDAVVAATAVLDRRSPRSSDVRTLVASGRLAFDDAPREFAKVQGIVLNRASEAIDDHTRSGTDRQDVELDDRQFGTTLFKLITEARGATL